MGNVDCAAVGSFGVLLVMPRTNLGDADPTFNGSSERYPYLQETLHSKRPVRVSKLITGGPSRYKFRKTFGPYVPRGSIILQLGPTEWASWLPRFVGPLSTGAYRLASATPPFFDCMCYRDNGVFYYRACQVASALVMGQTSDDGDGERSVVNLQLNIIAREEDLSKSWPGTIPTLVDSANYSPYMFFDTGFKVNSTSRDYEGFDILIDHGLRPKMRQSRTPNCVWRGPRTVKARLRRPFTATNWTEEQTIYSTGAAVKITLAKDDDSLVIDIPNLTADQETPVVASHDEITLTTQGEALATVSGNDEIYFTSTVV